MTNEAIQDKLERETHTHTGHSHSTEQKKRLGKTGCLDEVLERQWEARRQAE